MDTNKSAHTQEEQLVDIRSVSVDKSLPKEKRLAEFVRKIGNPYRFGCGDFIVNVTFANNGVSLEERLRGIIR